VELELDEVSKLPTELNHLFALLSSVFNMLIILSSETLHLNSTCHFSSLHIHVEATECALHVHPSGHGSIAVVCQSIFRPQH